VPEKADLRAAEKMVLAASGLVLYCKLMITTFARSPRSGAFAVFWHLDRWQLFVLIHPLMVQKCASRHHGKRIKAFHFLNGGRKVRPNQEA